MAALEEVGLPYSPGPSAAGTQCGVATRMSGSSDMGTGEEKGRIWGSGTHSLKSSLGHFLAVSSWLLARLFNNFEPHFSLLQCGMNYSTLRK